MRPVDSRQVAKAEADEAENAHVDAAHLEQAGLEKDIILHFAPGDVDNPRNWSAARKYYIVVLVCMLNIWTTLCAGGYSTGYSGIEESFHVSAEVATIGLAVYIFGLAVGPMIFAPLSEYFGRSPVYCITWALCTVFQIPLAVAPNIGTVLSCRFLQGFFGSAPLTNIGGTISDLFERDESGYAMALYAFSSTSGPPLALIISSYIPQTIGWRWLFWLYLIIFGVYEIILVLTIKETRHNIILEKRAKKMRKETGNPRIYDPAGKERSLHHLFFVSLTRPFVFLFTEPITLLSALYNGFLYGLVYLFNEALPVVFGEGGHNFNGGATSLCFLGLWIGSLIGLLLHPVQERYYLRRVSENDKKSVPEARMYMSLVGAFLIPIGLFWFAWTSYPSINFIVPVIGSGVFGLGLYIIILAILNFVVDSYQTYAASALAGVILVRNLFGAGFPMFASGMYANLGAEWASSTLAFLSLLLIPIPILFFFKGQAIRLRSPWAREHFNSDGSGSH